MANAGGLAVEYCVLLFATKGCPEQSPKALGVEGVEGVEGVIGWSFFFLFLIIPLPSLRISLSLTEGILSLSSPPSPHQ